MPVMIIFVLDDISRLPDVEVAWRAAGSCGITILESSGAARLLGRLGAPDDLPMFPSLSNMLTRHDVHNRTLFTVLDDSVDLDAFFAATEAVVGSLEKPNSGIMVALPVLAARGLHRRQGSAR